MGWLSNLFQKTAEVEYVDDKGHRHTKRVPKDQFDAVIAKLMADGKATIHDACRVHILDPNRDPCTENWIIGEQVSRETYERFKDKDGNLYVCFFYEIGKQKKMVVQKVIWEQMAQQFDNIRRQSSYDFEKIKRDLGF